MPLTPTERIMAQQLDCRGLACPEPVLRCRDLIRAQRPAALTVLVDNVAAQENVCRFLGRNGYAAASEQQAENLWEIRATATAQDAPAAPAAAPAPSRLGKTLVLITTQTLGRGDDTLGEKLMGNFLASLGELGESLWRIVLLNGGVKLAAAPGAALDSLQKLEAAGVEILVCGTCLQFYGLLDARRVGQTTNMMDVVTSLALADKVIRP